ncbi:hypothetical protein SK066_21665 [Paenibacillus hunanensis]|nr:hypothetical protein [Paenibacillus hunanensis]MCL9660876.1 hypothetical protein [Paenibacillus hunanensis]WPP41136.1 hypothetical protein SK066_21665 [Paenibacillus hunanensis]
MIALVLIEFADVLKMIAASLSIVLSGRRLYRLVRRKLKNKQKKPTE